ncbi:MAG TPA: DUF6249 domain-containing protein [Gammaproteobacteria bacterium]|jgi:stage III sporulation protein SpoIIIAA
MEGVVLFLIPIVLFVSVAVVISMVIYWSYRTRREVQATVRIAIEKGQELTPELLERLGQLGPSSQADLRRGVIALATGLGIAAFGVLVGEEDAVRPLLAISALPALIGLAYLGLWRFSSRD